ncbi:MAG: hypothetical protein KUG82_14215 [Pseudomonadales bacterium]|mgnify:CR=1 FL=1|nr:hypothetical protein [Pseudomonadales bacterium]
MKTITELLDGSSNMPASVYDLDSDEFLFEDDFPLLSDLQFVAPEEILEQLAMPNQETFFEYH